MSDKKLHIVLIGNYRKDHQRSMILFLQMLKDGYTANGHNVDVWLPTTFFGVLSGNTLSGIGKWLAYLDKYILFPLVLKWRCIKPQYAQSRFHICDHSNAVYVPYLPYNRTLVTCHDVLAIKGAFGDKSVFCDASRAGKVLQNWILKSLLKAGKIATVSQTTLIHLNELAQNNKKPGAKWQVVLNAFNEPFGELPKEISDDVLKQAGLNLTDGFMLHVGSGLPRKNRKMLLKMLNLLRNDWRGSVVFAGQAIDPELQSLIQYYQLEDRVVSVVNPDFNLLQTLYSACDAFVFPSYSEGFGWPVIEAQACGACVLASDFPAICEVGGEAALYAQADDAPKFADNFREVLKPEVQQQLNSKAQQNILRFDKQNMIENYIKLIQE